jgi:hypothetical protein
MSTRAVLTRICPTCRQLAISPGKAECAACEYMAGIPPKPKPEAVVMVVPLGLFNWFAWGAIVIVCSLVIYTVCQLFA